MQASATESRARWGVAGGGALAAIATLALLFRFPAPPTTLPRAMVESRKAVVTIATPDENNQLLKEQAELRDMRPLFLPTPRNAALPEPRLETGRTFLENETLKLIFTDTEAHVSRDLPPTALLGAKRVEDAKELDVLSPKENALTLDGFGRTEATIITVKVRSGYVQVTALKDGSRVVDEELPSDARPPGNKGWAPIQMIATVDAAGLVGDLVVTEGSRLEETDSYFKSYLARTFRIGDRLEPGFYQITLSP